MRGLDEGSQCFAHAWRWKYQGEIDVLPQGTTHEPTAPWHDSAIIEGEGRTTTWNPRRISSGYTVSTYRTLLG
jgi:hypothetical protein